MAKAPKVGKQRPEGDPTRGDAILKRMLKAKPKTHDEMVEERHAQAKRKTKAK